MFTELTRVVQRVRESIDESPCSKDDIISLEFVQSLLDTIDDQIKLSERQVFEALGYKDRS